MMEGADDSIGLWELFYYRVLAPAYLLGTMRYTNSSPYRKIIEIK